MPTKAPDDWDFHKAPYVAALRNFIGLRDPRAQVLLHAAPGNRFKLKVSTLRLPDVVGASGLTAASHCAWRYLAEASGLAVACELALDGLRITTLIHGQAAEQAMKALIALPQNDGTGTAGHDLEQLRIGGVHVDAYWLRARNGASNDLISPFSTPPKHALNRKPGDPPMAPAYFLDAIKPIAQTHLDFYSGAATRAAGKASSPNAQTAPLRSRAAGRREQPFATKARGSGKAPNIDPQTGGAGPEPHRRAHRTG